MCDEIPTEEHDERMDLVISENGIIRIKKRCAKYDFHFRTPF